MSHNLQEYQFGGRDCWHAAVNPLNADAGTVVYLPGGQEEFDLVHEICGSLSEAVESGACKPFMLAGFVSEDWNSDFSPWPAPALFKKSEEFGGNGRATLDWMEQSYMRDAEERLGLETPKRAIIGYSLAGLFALWCIYQTDLFSICASCSGSLWFEGWMDYAKTNKPNTVERLYLSLGDREEKARNPVMAMVGDNTREMAEIIKAKLPDAETMLESNEGGHFDDIGVRILKALKWLMRY